MTKDEIENDVVLLAQVAERVAKWHPDALAFMEQEIIDAAGHIQTALAKINKARAA